MHCNWGKHTFHVFKISNNVPMSNPVENSISLPPSLPLSPSLPPSLPYSGLQGEFQHHWEHWGDCLQRRFLHLGCQRRGQGKKKLLSQNPPCLLTVKVCPGRKSHWSGFYAYLLFAKHGHLLVCLNRHRITTDTHMLTDSLGTHSCSVESQGLFCVTSQFLNRFTLIIFLLWLEWIGE